MTLYSVPWKVFSESTLPNVRKRSGGPFRAVHLSEHWREANGSLKVANAEETSEAELSPGKT